ncbi:MAG TPA: AAA family ATPase, partial [Reyranella sp.]|nr:AAA family ATPase [Reyranella sp.]
GCIRTIHRRGFRLVAPVEEITADQQSAPAPVVAPPVQEFVGREDELALLQGLLKKASAGERQVVFVTGEAGIGKTTLVRTFLASAIAPGRAAVARAQCIELYGTSEPYLPIFEAMQRLGAEIGADKLASYLRSFAPTWLAQMPWLADASQPAASGPGATSQRMLRELAQALEALSASRPIVLWLEDLHWSDHSTLDAISFLARRTESARLLVVGSYRPGDASTRGHPIQPVKEAIALSGACTELALGFLGLGDIAVYLQRRFGLDPAELSELSQFIYARTDGNPLFVVALADDLVRTAALVRSGISWQLTRPVSEIGLAIPHTVQVLIGQRIESLAAKDRHVLQVAAVGGAEFSAAAIAAALDVSVEAVEEVCDRLVQRRQFIVLRGSDDWPDGTVANRYAFVHAMYQQGLASRVSEARRIEWQGKIAAREERAHGKSADEIAAQLAVRFEAARQYDHSAKYFEIAANNALAGSAYIEAARLFGKAIDMLPQAGIANAAQAELRMLLPRGIAVIGAHGYATGEVEKIYQRALSIAREQGDQPAIVRVLHSVWTTAVAQAQMHKAQALAVEIADHAERTADKAMLFQAWSKLGQTSFHLGVFGVARVDLEKAMAMSEDMPEEERARNAAYLAWTLWYVGFPDAALRVSEEGMRIARVLKGHYGLVFSVGFAAWVHAWRGELVEAERLVDEALEISTEYGLPFWITWTSCLKGLIQGKRGDYAAGLARMQKSLAGYRATGALIGLVHFMTEYAEIALLAGDVARGLAVIEEARAICTRTGNRYHGADTHRVQGELLIAADRVDEGEARLLHALQFARGNSARSLELRALTTLARRSPDWLDQLRATRSAFTEGYNTVDLRLADEVLQRA